MEKSRLFKFLGYGLVGLIVFVAIGYFTSKSLPKDYETVGKYKSDLGCTFIDFAKRYNNLVTKDNPDSAYEKYSIRPENVKDTVYENGIVKTECELGDDLDVLSIDVYWDSKTKKVKKILVSCALLKHKIAVYSVMTSCVVNAVYNDSAKKALGMAVLRTLKFFNRAMVNESYVDNVPYENLKFSLVIKSTSSRTPLMFFSVSPNE